MIRHVFMLIWNRKRANALILLELLVAFLILFALAGFSLNLYRLYGRPLGFNVADTWSVGMETGGAWTEADAATYREVLSVLEQFEEIAAVELMYDRPFDIGGSSGSVSVNGVFMPNVMMNVVTPGFPEAVGMELVEGRWFGPEDDRQEAGSETIAPIVVNRIFSDMAGGDVVGKVLPGNSERRLRVIGMFEDFRQKGQFSATGPFMLQRTSPTSTTFRGAYLVLVVKPSITAQFEERLLGALQRTAPGWDFDVNTWESLQDGHLRFYLIPLLIVSGLVLFLLFMVGFGLLGVLWQNIIRRSPEMGLRRAVGAPAGAVRLQVVLELVAVATLALVLGLAIVVQFPLTGVLPPLDWALFIPAAITSTLVLLGLCVVFALYPSFQATRRDPVDALRYE